jgi:hypothetical protein
MARTGSRSSRGRESGEPVVFHGAGDGRVSGVTIGPFSLSRFDQVDQ